jgi:hypothetical protein
MVMCNLCESFSISIGNKRLTDETEKAGRDTGETSKTTDERPEWKAFGFEEECRSPA